MSRPLTPTQASALSAAFAPAPVVTAWHTSEPDDVRTLPVIDGELLYSAGSQERTSARLTLPLRENDGTTWFPESWQSFMVPNDLVLAFDYGLGVGPPVRCAHLWLDDVAVGRPDGTVTLSAYSRATRMSQVGFPAGDRRYVGSTVAVITAIVADTLGPGVLIEDRGLVGPDVVAGTVFDGDPWDAIESLCDAAGWEAFFDHRDVLVLRPTPTGGPPAAWTFATGPGGTITAYDVTLTRAPNRMSLAFQHPTDDADVVGTADATGNVDPAGPYGLFRADETRTGVVTQVEADAAAREFLTRAGGLLRSLTLQAVPHPGVEVGDSITVRFATGATELHRVTEVRLPLTPGEPMTLSTRATPW